MKIVTFNLRTDVKVDGENRFQFRKGIILDKLTNEAPDVVGFQEVAPAMAAFLSRYLDREYMFVGCGRMADFSCESCKIAFRRDKYELLALDTFWLSDTPHIPGSRFACASEYPRVCTHVMLRPVDGGTPFHIYNTHLDHLNDEARTLGAKTILARMADDLEKWDYPAAVMGDMNAEPASRPIRTFLEDPVLGLTDHTANIPVSFHDYGRIPGVKIDYILSRGMKSTSETRAWDDVSDGIYLSDHYPLCAELDLEK